MENWNFAQWLNWFSPVLSVEDASFVPSLNCTQPLIVTRRALRVCARGSVARIVNMWLSSESCYIFIKISGKELDNWKFVETSGISQRWWMSVSLLRRLVAGPSLRRPGFDPGPVSVGLWRTQCHWARFFFESVRFPWSICSMLILLPITLFKLRSW